MAWFGAMTGTWENTKTLIVLTLHVDTRHLFMKTFVLAEFQQLSFDPIERNQIDDFNTIALLIELVEEENRMKTSQNNNFSHPL